MENIESECKPSECTDQEPVCDVSYDAPCGCDPYDVESRYWRKVLDLQNMICKADWTPDKAYSVQGNIVRYVSLTKMKATILPLMTSCGLSLRMAFDDPTKLDPAGKQSQHWMVRMTVWLVDADTGFGTCDVVWGEAGDSGDKGLTKAESIALMRWMSNKFLLADGIDFDEDTDTSAPRFTKRSDAETEELKSKVLEKADKPALKQDVPEEPAAPGTQAGEEVPRMPNATGFKLEGPQAKAIHNITLKWEKAAKEGKVTPERYSAMSYDVVNIASAADAVAFIRKYMEIR